MSQVANQKRLLVMFTNWLSINSRHVDLTKIENLYGKVFRLYLGSQLVVVVSGEEAIKDVLVTKWTKFAGCSSL